MAEVYYKTMNGTAGAYGHGEWSLPTDDGPGEWMPPVKPVMCESGYHVCRSLREVLWHAGPELYEVEVRGEHVDGDDKAAYEEARLLRLIPGWNERNLRLFAVDCARRVAHRTPNPELTNACLDVCVAYAEFGEEWAAARAAAWTAARAAAWAAQTAILSRYLAGEEGPLVEADDA